MDIAGGMKQVEPFQFALANKFCCKRTGEDLNACGTCSSCILINKLSESTKWLTQARCSLKCSFLLGLIARCKNVGILESIQNVLHVTSGKDFTYTRSKKPTLEDMVTFTALRGHDDGNLFEVEMVEVLDWFRCSHDWIKSHYLLGVLSLCDTELLRMLNNLISVHLVREKHQFLQFNGTEDTGDDALPLPEHAVNQHSYPHTELHMQASSVFKPTDLHSKIKMYTDRMPESDFEHPALMVVPRSSASMSGVSRYKDFIRSLPVHLAKNILGLLDQNTLRHCRTVSLHWRYLAEDTMKDIHTKKVLQKQFMKLQSSRCTRMINDNYAKILQVLVPADCAEGDILSNDPKIFQDVPFASAYAAVRTKTVQMEERNIYCGIYNTTMLLDKEARYRVVDYRGGGLVAVGSRDSVVRLLSLATEKEMRPPIKGHVGSIRGLLLCEDRDLVVSASYDCSIRCWSLKTKACTVYLYGHTGTITCLDIHGDKLVSGAEDCKVKVWNLQTGKCLDKLKFQHRGCVRCVKISASLVHSSCDKGLVKVWDIQSASLLRVIDAHRSSVKCLFFDQWYLLSGDSDGQVMAWSTNRQINKCLVSFRHPMEVRTVILLYLRVITGCMDGKIRIFNFLSGDCLKIIMAESTLSPILSLHAHDNNIVVNTTMSVKLYSFSKVSWDYTVAAEKQPDTPGAQAELHSKTPSPRKSLYGFVRAARVAQVCSLKRKSPNRKGKKTEMPPCSYQPRALTAPRFVWAQELTETPCLPVALRESERATGDRIKKRGLHHPLTTDSILLRANAVRKALCADEASVNMELNARLRDAWGPPPPSQPELRPSKALQHCSPPQKPPLHRERTGGLTKTFVPISTRPVDHFVRNTPHSGAGGSGDSLAERHPFSMARSHCLRVQRVVRKVGAFTTSAEAEPQAPERMLLRATCMHSEGCVKAKAAMMPKPRTPLTDLFREHRGFGLLTDTQLQGYIRAQIERMQNSGQKSNNKESLDLQGTLEGRFSV